MCYLTSGVSAKDEFSDLIVNKDEETVRERTEPPAGPERERRESNEEHSTLPALCISFITGH